MHFYMAALQGFEPRNVGIKIRCLRPTWRKGYMTLQIFKEQVILYDRIDVLARVVLFYRNTKQKTQTF